MSAMPSPIAPVHQPLPVLSLNCETATRALGPSYASPCASSIDLPSVGLVTLAFGPKTCASGAPNHPTRAAAATNIGSTRFHALMILPPGEWFLGWPAGPRGPVCAGTIRTGDAVGPDQALQRPRNFDVEPDAVRTVLALDHAPARVDAAQHAPALVRHPEAERPARRAKLVPDPGQEGVEPLAGPGPHRDPALGQGLAHEAVRLGQ